MITISSQRYRDDEIVQSKSNDNDYMVCVSPLFEINGMTVRVVLDGHHSLEAANIDGVQPEYYEQDSSNNAGVASSLFQSTRPRGARLASSLSLVAASPSGPFLSTLTY